jgi:glycerol kinase
VDGGATVNDFLMQFQSDVLQCQVIRPAVTETTALGAAYLAGLAVGFWQDIDDIKEQWTAEKSFAPSITSEKRDELYNGWNRAIRSTQAE